MMVRCFLITDLWNMRKKILVAIATNWNNMTTGIHVYYELFGFGVGCFRGALYHTDMTMKVEGFRNAMLKKFWKSVENRSRYETLVYPLLPRVGWKQGSVDWGSWL